MPDRLFHGFDVIAMKIIDFYITYFMIVNKYSSPTLIDCYAICSCFSRTGSNVEQTVYIIAVFIKYLYT